MSKELIPRVIHYCWFGGKPKPKSVMDCIETWKKYCPDFSIIEWNENNFDINSNRYAYEAYCCKKWAFVSDYVRLKALRDYGGGVYLDTDVELLKPLDDFLSLPAFIGFESNDMLESAIIGSEKNNKWISLLLSYYDNRTFIAFDGTCKCTPNVQIITRLTSEYYGEKFKKDNSFQQLEDCSIYPKEFFCPKDHKTCETNLTSNTYSIHHFDASWTKGMGHKSEDSLSNRIKRLALRRRSYLSFKEKG